MDNSFNRNDGEGSHEIGGYYENDNNNDNNSLLNGYNEQNSHITGSYYENGNDNYNNYNNNFISQSQDNMNEFEENLEGYQEGLGEYAQQNLEESENHNNFLNIDNLPVNELNNVDNLDENNKKCVICMEDFAIGDRTISLSCIHIFHADCIKNWLIRDKSCPICKYKFND